MTKILKYNLTVCSNPKLVWFRNAKVGTRSTFALLKDMGLEFEIEHDFNVEYNPRKYTNHLKFSMVRNPWDRLVSGWKNKIQNKDKSKIFSNTDQLHEFQSFDRFSRHICKQNLQTFNNHFRFQSQNIHESVDLIGRFENFSSDLCYILAQVGIDAQNKIPHKNKTANRDDYREYYSSETRDLVSVAFREDIQRYGYSFE